MEDEVDGTGAIGRLEASGGRACGRGRKGEGTEGTYCWDAGVEDGG
jgi:hypothetical protein